MHGLVAGDDVAALHSALVVVEVGHEAAGLAHHQHARGEIPGRQVAFPIRIEPSGRDVGEVERGGAEAPQASDLFLHGGDLAAELREFAGPLSETCSFSTSPKSRLSARPALRAAAVMTLIRADGTGTNYSARRT